MKNVNSFEEKLKRWEGANRKRSVLCRLCWCSFLANWWRRSTIQTRHVQQHERAARTPTLRTSEYNNNSTILSKEDYRWDLDNWERLDVRWWMIQKRHVQQHQRASTNPTLCKSEYNLDEKKVHKFSQIMIENWEKFWCLRKILRW